jgi:hypothetical protein
MRKTPIFVVFTAGNIWDMYGIWEKVYFMKESKKNLLEQVEGLFKSIQAKVWRKPKVKKRNTFWNPSNCSCKPKNKLKGSSK